MLNINTQNTQFSNSPPQLYPNKKLLLSEELNVTAMKEKTIERRVGLSLLLTNYLPAIILFLPDIGFGLFGHDDSWIKRSHFGYSFDFGLFSAIHLNKLGRFNSTDIGNRDGLHVDKFYQNYSSA